MKKVISPAEELKLQCKQLVREIEHWKTINEYGCNDPFWPDGTNMNLTRNHIIYHKMSIRQICGENCLSLPDEYYIPTPPKVPEEYMAGLAFLIVRFVNFKGYGEQFFRLGLDELVERWEYSLANRGKRGAASIPAEAFKTEIRSERGYALHYLKGIVEE